MTRRSNLRFALLSLPAGVLFAADKAPPFKAGAASSYPAHQKLEDLTIGIKPYDTAELAKEAFGSKINPNQYEVLPVLVVIENNRKNAVRCDRMQIEYVIPGLGKLEHTPFSELRSAVGPTRPNTGPNPLPIPRSRVKKNPLNAPEIEERAWSAKMIPPGETASGFFFFQTRHRTSARLYLTGLFEPATGKELFYYEVPFTP